MYQIGELVVKRTKGVCKIEDIMNPEFVQDHKKMYYRLTPLLDGGAKIYVPVDSEDGSMRRIMTEAEAENLIHKIPEITETWVHNEKERERNYKDAIQSNNPERLIGIIKLLYHRKKNRQAEGKKTTAIDGRYYDFAEKLLYSELETVMGKSRQEIYNMIVECCENS